MTETSRQAERLKKALSKIHDTLFRGHECIHCQCDECPTDDEGCAIDGDPIHTQDCPYAIVEQAALSSLSPPSPSEQQEVCELCDPSELQIAFEELYEGVAPKAWLPQIRAHIAHLESRLAAQPKAPSQGERQPLEEAIRALEKFYLDRFNGGKRVDSRDRVGEIVQMYAQPAPSTTPGEAEAEKALNTVLMFANGYVSGMQRDESEWRTASDAAIAHGKKQQAKLDESAATLRAALSRGTVDYWLWQFARSVVAYADIEDHDLNESTAFRELIDGLRGAVKQCRHFVPSEPPALPAPPSPLAQEKS